MDDKTLDQLIQLLVKEHNEIVAKALSQNHERENNAYRDYARSTHYFYHPGRAVPSDVHSYTKMFLSKVRDIVKAAKR